MELLKPSKTIHRLPLLLGAARSPVPPPPADKAPWHEASQVTREVTGFRVSHSLVTNAPDSHALLRNKSHVNTAPHLLHQLAAPCSTVLSQSV